MADISQVKLPNGDTYNLVDETSGYIKNYTEIDPVFSASAAAGITATDISNWNGKTSNTGTITSVKTTAGKHTTINITSGAANFNVPTHTSHLTNDSGFITSDSDEKLKTTQIESGFQSWYLIFGSSSSNAENKFFDSNFTYKPSTEAELTLGSSNAKAGCLCIYKGANKVLLRSNNLTTNRTIYFPDKNGTIALTSDIPSVYSSTNTGGYLTMATLPIYDGTVV